MNFKPFHFILIGGLTASAMIVISGLSAVEQFSDALEDGQSASVHRIWQVPAITVGAIALGLSAVAAIGESRQKPPKPSILPSAQDLTPDQMRDLILTLHEELTASEKQ